MSCNGLEVQSLPFEVVFSSCRSFDIWLACGGICTAVDTNMFRLCVGFFYSHLLWAFTASSYGIYNWFCGVKNMINCDKGYSAVIIFLCATENLSVKW